MLLFDEGAEYAVREHKYEPHTKRMARFTIADKLRLFGYVDRKYQDAENCIDEGKPEIEHMIQTNLHLSALCSIPSQM